jgi:hypothetical protein
MGLQYVSAGSIRWKGDEYYHASSFGGNQFELDGKLVPNESGLAGELWATVTFKRKNETKSNVVTWIWSYTYDEGRPYSFLPSRMAQMVIVNKVRKVSDEIRILRLELSDVAMPADSFDFHGYLLPDSTVYYSSNQTFYSMQDGVWKERMKPDNSRIVMPKQKNHKMIRVAYVIIALMLLAPLGFLWKAQRKSEEGAK